MESRTSNQCKLADYPAEDRGLRVARIEDSDLTIQELVLRKWDDEWDERLKSHIQRIADEMSCTWWDIVMENQEFVVEPDFRWDIND